MYGDVGILSLLYPLRSSLPCFVNSLAAKQLTLLQQNHRPPLRLVDRIHEPARFHTEPSSLVVCRCTIDRRHIDVLASVELECRLRAVHLEMQARACVAKLRQAA